MSTFAWHKIFQGATIFTTIAVAPPVFITAMFQIVPLNLSVSLTEKKERARKAGQRAMYCHEELPGFYGGGAVSCQEILTSLKATKKYWSSVFKGEVFGVTAMEGWYF